MQEYIEDANARQVLVGASLMGKRIEEIKQESPNAATMSAAILAPKWVQTSQPTARELVSMFRSIALANPNISAFDNLLDASKSAAESKQAQEASRAAAEALSAFIKETIELISNLENLYHKQLTIQEPAISWQNIAVQEHGCGEFGLRFSLS